jgi:hypothetical protein
MGLGHPNLDSLRIILLSLDQKDEGESKGRYAEGIGQNEIGHRDGKCGLDE